MTNPSFRARSFAAAFLLLQLPAHQSPALQAASSPSPRRKENSARSLPLRFEPGHTRFDAIARGRGYTLVLNDGAATIALPSADGHRSVIRMSLVGGNPNTVATPIDQQAGVSNYLLGSDPSAWRTGVGGYGKVRYSGVYPDIDLLFYGNAGSDLEYDFIVAPGGDPSAIAVRFEGADEIRVDAKGELVLSAGTAEVRIKLHTCTSAGRMAGRM